jgi:hypothetical protein
MNGYHVTTAHAAMRRSEADASARYALPARLIGDRR